MAVPLLGERSGRLRLAEGGAERRCRQDGAFGAVVSVEAVQHFPRLVGVEGEMARILRPGRESSPIRPALSQL